MPLGLLNPLLLAAVFIGCAGGCVLVFRRRFQDRFLQGLGFVAAGLGFGVLAAASIFPSAMAPALAWAAGLGGALPAPPAWMSRSAMIKQVRAGTIAPPEYLAGLDERLAAGQQEWEWTAQIIGQEARGGRLPASLALPMAEWLVKNFPLWLDTLGREDDSLLPSVIDLPGVTDEARLALVDVVLARLEDPTADCPRAWLGAVENLVVRGRLDPERTARYMERRLVPPVMLEPAKCVPGELVSVGLDRSAGPGRARPYAELPWRSRAAVASPPEIAAAPIELGPWSFSESSDTRRIGWVIAPETPGPFEVPVEFELVLPRDLVWQHFDWNPHLIPAGARLHEIPELSVRRTVVLKGVVGPVERAPAELVADEATAERMRAYIAARPRFFFALRRSAKEGFAASIHIRGRYRLSVELSGPPVGAAFDVILEMDGRQEKLGWIFAPEGGADALHVEVGSFDWKRQTPFLILRPNPGPARTARGAGRLYNGPEIRFELDVLVEWAP